MNIVEKKNTFCEVCKTFDSRGLAADGIVVNEGRILLIKRNSASFKNTWALPGGFVEWNETVEEAALREVTEETGLKKLAIQEMIGIYSVPTRDERQVITVAFWMEGSGEPKGADDAKEAAWFEIDKLPSTLAFDHAKIISDFIFRRNRFPAKKVVFAAMSKRNFYLREHIVKYVLKKGYTPTSAFMMYSYFLLDTVEREALISANNDLIKRSDELWVFGEISDGVQAEIDLAERIRMKIKYFKIDQFPNGVKEVNSPEDLFEEM